MSQESTGAIVTAAAANLAIAAAKFVGYALTGSVSMMAEGVHSVVDTTNQGLLLFGLKRAERPADAQHPFGFGREVYFYSFVVALLIFVAGGAYSIYEGIEKIIHVAKAGHVEASKDAVIFGHHVPSITLNLAILGFAIAAEGYSFIVAFKAMPGGGGSALTKIRRSKDPSLFVVLAEDFAALAGLVLALLGVGLAHLLQKPVLDGVASICIGVLLVGVAFFLMRETHGLLVGEAADPKIVAGIEELVRGEPAVRQVNEILTQHLGPNDILLNLSLDLDDAINAGDVEALVSRLDVGLRQRHEAVRRIFIEIRAAGTRDGALRPR